VNTHMVVSLHPRIPGRAGQEGSQLEQIIDWSNAHIETNGVCALVWDKALLRVWDRMSRSQPEQDGRPIAKASRQRLDTPDAHVRTLIISRSLEFDPTPYISFTDSPRNSCPSSEAARSSRAAISSQSTHKVASSVIFPLYILLKRCNIMTSAPRTAQIIIRIIICACGEPRQKRILAHASELILQHPAVLLQNPTQHRLVVQLAASLRNMSLGARGVR